MILDSLKNQRVRLIFFKLRNLAVSSPYLGRPKTIFSALDNAAALSFGIDSDLLFSSKGHENIKTANVQTRMHCLSEK